MPKIAEQFIKCLAWMMKKFKKIWKYLNSIRMELTCNEIHLNIEKDFYELNEGL